MKNLIKFNFLSIAPFAILVLLANIDFKESAKLEGFWVHESNNQELRIYDRQNTFQKGKPGIAFLKNGKLLKRQNSGWCGTPPISYSNFDGTWEWLDDQTISIHYEFWGGTIKETWEIKKLNKKAMTILSKDFETFKDERSH